MDYSKLVIQGYKSNLEEKVAVHKPSSVSKTYQFHDLRQLQRGKDQQ